ncbi:TetR/AcrR family transcriptional regulator [Photobacterium sp. BZF1]|uniref:TetR/AcrR family transcriptional regulator n=1 Tax=Photobacterium sp. BZF1 TaxID=1904457 RepID=UPI0016537B4C|nr:TetR/AcrR family transcriptional regulator [Photobacterium sp. BZF1]MBC7003597.1 TetR/AcrR family transcriptional regulator [Photobacterium sp. BZF1]
MSKKKAKTEKILDVSIELLKSEGDFGISMRKVATLADMSLSNVQYYFKNKDALLIAMADRYFQQCLDEISSQSELAEQQDLKPLVHAFLAHGLEISDMCRIFREYWALSTRNEAIEDYLSKYYQTLAGILSDKLKHLAVDESSLGKAVSIFIPYVEGYSITAKSLPQDFEVMSAVLSDVIWKCLRREM